MPDRRFDAVLFDAGGIFLVPDPTVLGPLLAYHGGDPSVEAHLRAHYAAMRAKSEAGADERDWREYDRAYVECAGVRANQVELAATVLGRTRHAYLWRFPLGESVDALRRLVELGVPVGVVSNASGQIAEVLAMSGVCQVGDGPAVPVRVIVDSHVVGVAKPDPRIFEPALAHLPGIPVERIAYVGDSVTMDVGGARAAGLHPVLLDPYDDHPWASFERVRSLHELVGWFAA